MAEKTRYSDEELAEFKEIILKKIEMAKRMIASDSAPISYIASSLCFYDSHHFFRTFIKYTGMSPSDYRKSLVEKEDP